MYRNNASTPIPIESPRISGSVIVHFTPNIVAIQDTWIGLDWIRLGTNCSIIMISSLHIANINYSASIHILSYTIFLIAEVDLIRTLAGGNVLKVNTKPSSSMVLEK